MACTLLLLLLFPALSTGLTLVGDVDLETYYGFPLIVQLYTQTQTNLTIDLSLGTGTDNIASLLNGETDFAIIPGPLAAAQAAAHPNATVLPILSSAIVPVYRLDALDSSISLTLSGSTLALIFAGQVTWWNDSHIAHDNLGVLFPNQSITVAYQNDSRWSTFAFTTALNKFNPSIASTLPPSKLPAWSTHRYANSRAGLGLTGVVALTLNNDGTIGFCHQQTALVANANTANMINRAGYTVTPGMDSVSFTVYEMQTQPTTLPTAFPDLTDCLTASCWPIVVTSWLLIDTSASPRGCAVRTELVNFWLWYYTSPLVDSTIPHDYEMVLTPLLIKNLYSVQSTLNSLTCNGQLVQDVTPSLSLSLIAPSRVQYVLDPITDFYVNQQQAVDFSYTASDDSIDSVFQGLATNTLTYFYLWEFEYDVLLANATGITINHTGIALDYDRHLLVPTFLTSTALTYNPRISSTVTLNSSIEVVLSPALYILMLAGNLSSWYDPRLLALNPVVARLLDGQPAPLSIVFGCTLIPGREPLLEEVGFSLFDGVPASDSSSIQPVVDNRAAIEAALATCSQYAPSWVYAIDERSAGGLIINTVGAVGYQLDGLSDGTGTAKFVLTWPYQTEQGVVMTERRSTPDALRSCVTAMDPDTLQLTLAPQLVSGCWPLTSVLYAQVPKDYPVAQKAEGYAGLSLLAWSINSTCVRPWSDSAMLIQVGSIPSLTAPLIAALSSVTSGGDTLLITLPIVWHVSVALQDVFIAVSVIGYLLVIGLFAFMICYRHHPVVRSTAPALHCVCLVGCLLLILAMQLLTRPMTTLGPTDVDCAGFNWETQLGFTLVFGPPFMKAYRIYCIFGRRKLEVVKISNTKLMAWFGVIVLGEVVYLSVWQAVAPMSAVVTLQLENDQREHSYRQCSFYASDTSLHFFVASVVIKAAWLCVGVLLAFSTRTVTDAFNESKSIALAIFNVVFIVGIIAPLIILINAIGDTLITLLLFGMAWVAITSLIILFLPKVLILLAARSNGSASPIKLQPGSLGSSLALLSVASSSTADLVRHVTALELRMGDVRRELRSRKGKAEVGSRVGRDGMGSPMVSPVDSRRRVEDGKDVTRVLTPPAKQNWMVGREASPSATGQTEFTILSKQVSHARSLSTDGVEDEVKTVTNR